MYSVVLMMALSGGADATACHGRNNASCGCAPAPVCAPAPAPACGCNGGRVGLLQRLHNRHNNGCGCVAVAAPCGCAGAVVVPEGCAGGTVVPPTTDKAKDMPPVTGKEPVKDPAKKPVEPIPAPGKVSAPATLIINLPADARLSVDGHATTSTTATRVLMTPSLAYGQEYHYNLTATVVREGQTLVQTQRVAVRPGSTTQYGFSFPTAPVTASR